jgi:hypothetical protein
VTAASREELRFVLANEADLRARRAILNSYTGPGTRLGRLSSTEDLSNQRSPGGRSAISLARDGCSMAIPSEAQPQRSTVPTSRTAAKKNAARSQAA